MNNIKGMIMKKSNILFIALAIISLVVLFSFLNREKTNDNQKEINDRQEDVAGIQEEKNDNKEGEDIQMKIKISNREYEMVYLLNDSQASKTLYEQLPLDINVENYGSNEKIFYPPEALDTNQTPLLQHGGEGTLGYFAPWGDVVMYYGACSSYNGLYVLGEAVSGSEYTKNLSGNIHVEKESDEL